MSDLVLIDTSAWFEAGRTNGDPETARIVKTHLEGRRAAMTEPTWIEIYRGIRGRREEALVSNWRNLCTWLPFDKMCWEESARVARACHRAGVNVPFGDILVDACARRYGAQLLERDKHFAMIADAIGK